jgi:hypothetical protein
MDLKKSTIIECIASTADRDVTNESLDIEGADITPLLEGRGFVNSDHSPRFEHLVGRVLDAKKIKSLEDCATPAQIKFWNEVKKPFIWTKAELFDGSGHKEADSIASIYKFYQNKNETPPVKVSVEGKTLERGPNGLLKRTLIKGIALTVHPCNRATKTEVVQITKSLGTEYMMKSETAVIPSFIEVADDSADRLYKLTLVARQLLAQASGLAKTEQEEKPVSGLELKSPALLERLKQLMATYKK